MKSTSPNVVVPAVDKWAVLLVTCLSAFLTPMMASSVNVAIPTIGREFPVDAVVLAWVASAYLLASAVFLVPFGKIADIFGRKKIFLYGIGVYTIGSFLCVVSTSAAMLIASRAFQGLGGAMIFGTGTAILTSVFPLEQRGRVLGINSASVYSGGAMGPFVGGVLTQYLGWRSIFELNVIVGLVIAAVTIAKLNGEWAEAAGERLDLVGSAIYTVAVTAFMCGLSVLPQVSGATMLAAGIIALVIFLLWENRVSNPVLNVALFTRNTVFAMSNLSALIHYSATFAISFLLSLYLQYVKGLGPQTAGIILVSQPIVQAIVSPIAGRMSDRREPRLLASAGMTLTMAGLILLSFLNDGTDVLYVVASLIITGVGFALFVTPNTNAIMSCVDRGCYGLASAIMSTMRLTGQMLSMGLATLVISLVVGNVQITPQYHSEFLFAFQTLFHIFAGFCFIGIFASLARGNLRQ